MTESIPQDFKVGNACGIPVHVHVLLVLYFVWVLAEAVSAHKPPAGELPDYSKAGLVALACSLQFLALFGTVLVHELGHCAGAKVVGGQVHRILLWPLGGLAFCGSGGGPAADLVVTLAGPLTHLPMYFLWKALHEVAERSSEELGAIGPILVSVCATAMWLQILLAAFNLLVPVYPLDCSRVLEALARLCGMPAAAAATMICTLSAVCIAVLLGSICGWVKLPYLHLGYSPMNLALLFWLMWQTLTLSSHLWQRSLRRHPLFEEDACSRQEERLPLGGRAQ